MFVLHYMSEALHFSCSTKGVGVTVWWIPFLCVIIGVMDTWETEFIATKDVKLLLTM